MDRKSASALLAFSCLLLVATVIGCGQVPGINWPGGGGFSGPARFAFVVNSQIDNNVDGVTISAYTVDSTTGALTPVSGSPFPTDASGCCGTTWIDEDPAGKFLFVPNRDAASVSVFAIGTTGSLSEISGSPFSTDGFDSWVVEVHPNGHFLYVSDPSAGEIQAFSIASDGTLTLLGSAPTVGSAGHLFMDPQGRFLYVSESGEGGTVEGYTIGSNGTLTSMGSPFAEMCNPKSGRVDDAGKFLLVADPCDDTVSVFRIDQTTGALTAVANSPFAAGERPFGVLEVPVGNTIYMAVNNLGDGTISVYTFDQSSGELSEVNGSPFSDLNLSAPHYMGLASAQFGYIVDQSNENIVGITLDASGTPTPIAGSPFSGGGISTPSQIIFSH